MLYILYILILETYSKREIIKNVQNQFRLSLFHFIQYITLFRIMFCT